MIRSARRFRHQTTNAIIRFSHQIATGTPLSDLSFARIHPAEGAGSELLTAEEAVRHQVVIMLALLGVCACSSGCGQAVLVPKIQFDHIARRPLFAEPVYAGPGGIGPIFSLPRITTPCRTCDPCGNSCNPCGDCGPCGGCVGYPVQPIDPFGWLRSGSMGTQEIDPVGWVFGL